MGSGIAEVCARSGVDVTVVEANDAGVARAQAAIARSLERGIRAGKLDAAESEAATERLAYTTALADLAGADAAIEAVIEDEDLKRDVFKQLDATVPDAQFLASNTSSVPIMKLGAETSHPGRVIGLHFFNPVPVLPLVEVVRSIMTSEETLEKAETYRAERFLGRFQRTLTLPMAVDVSKVQASYKDGILTVTLPKAEETKPKQIQVKVD